MIASIYNDIATTGAMNFAMAVPMRLYFHRRS
jgi:hypothetical protein